MKIEFKYKYFYLSIFCLTLFLLASFHDAKAYGAPDFLPDGPHPRIWLTSDELIRLNNKQSSNSSDWVALEAWCDAHINDAGYDVDPANQSTQDLTNWNGNNTYFGYRMDGYAKNLMNFALAYQILKDDNPAKALTYANRVRTLMIDGIAVALRSGEENNGLKAIRVGALHDVTVNAAEAAALGIGAATYKQGYSTRSLSAVPIAYDWIYESGVMLEGDKTLLTNMMLRWYDWMRGVRSTYNNGVLIGGTRYYEDQDGSCTGVNNCTALTGIALKGLNYGAMGFNFMGGHTYLSTLIPIALNDGGNADIASIYIPAMKTLLTGTVIEQLENPFEQSGGDSPEGWNYGGGYIYVEPALYGYYTATGDPTIQNMTWIPSLPMAMVNRLMPDMLTEPIYGYWTGVPFGVNRKTPALIFTGIEQRLHPTSAASKVGQYLLDNVTYSDSVTEWQNALWYNPDIVAESPSILPLTHAAIGNGFFTSHSSWTDPLGILLGVRLEGKKVMDHEGYDEGDISLSRGTDRLLTHSNSAADSPPSVSFNTIVFNNTSHHANNPSLTSLAIKKTETSSEFAYVSGDITNAWKRQFNTNRAELFQREVLHVLPGFIVVYDITRSNSAIGNLKEWYTQYVSDPVETADTISATVGASNVFVKTLFPQGGTYSETIPYAGSYRVKYTPAINQEYDQFLHVIQATSSIDSQTSATLISGIGGRGALIQDSTKDIVAMFTSDQGGASMNSLSYEVNTAITSKHIIANLFPNQKYVVSIDTVNVVEYTASDAGIIEFINSTGGIHSYEISNAPIDAVAPAAPNGLAVL